MKNVVYGVLFLAVVGITVIGCQKESIKPNTSSSKPIEEDDISSLIKIIPIQKRILEIKSKKPVVIVQWEKWGRKAKKCDGWGLCNAEWLPHDNEVSLKQAKNSNGAATILEFDHNLNQYYIDILLAEATPTYIPLHELNLRIDENIELLNIQDFSPTPLTLPNGTYSINNSLGTFGGYRIYLN